MAQVKLFGYVDKISVKPGDTIGFHVNADGTETAEAQLVRFTHRTESVLVHELFLAAAFAESLET